jgi:hypothetical protein
MCKFTRTLRKYSSHCPAISGGRGLTWAGNSTFFIHGYHGRRRKPSIDKPQAEQIPFGRSISSDSQYLPYSNHLAIFRVSRDSIFLILDMGLE